VLPAVHSNSPLYSIRLPAFKHFLKKHAERYERKSLNYACMAYIVREGGFLVVLLARFSAIPGHFTTAVFATVGMGFFVFTLATLLSMPKQLLVVYLGVALEQAGSGGETTKSKVIKYVVLIVSTLVTIVVAVYLYGKMQQARPFVQKQLQERRFNMLTEAGSVHAVNSSSEEGHLVGEEGSSKLYGQEDSGVYSMDDLEHARLTAKKGKESSRWKKWGKKEKRDVGRSQHGVLDSSDSFEKDRNSSGKIVMENGARVSFEADSLTHSGGGGGGRADETLKSANLHYVRSRPEQPYPAQQHQYIPQQAYQPPERYGHPRPAPPFDGQRRMPEAYSAAPTNPAAFTQMNQYR
jgi:hypothetical protein